MNEKRKDALQRRVTRCIKQIDVFSHRYFNFHLWSHSLVCKIKKDVQLTYDNGPSATR
jgi:hypothetical protein